MDTCYDVHSNLGLWLEFHLEHNPEDNEFLFGYDGLDNPIRIKERLSCFMHDTMSRDSFQLDSPGLVGTHSVRKCAVTFA